MLYETSARAREVLALDVPDLHLWRKEARIVGRVGTSNASSGASKTVRLLAGTFRAVSVGRCSSPTDAEYPGCPIGTCARIPGGPGSPTTTPPKEQSGGRTLRQLRRSSLTHLAAMGANAAQLQAESPTPRRVLTPQEVGIFSDQVWALSVIANSSAGR